MTPERGRLALRATALALRIRQKAGIPPDQPCCVFDVAENLGIEVRFAELPSAEGVYSPGKPVIVVSSLRPPGRQAFTCAHELGHHVYGHGEQFEELVEDRAKNRSSDPKEFEADCFASALLIPKTGILRGMAARGWNSKTISAEQVYTLASWLGVGYVTLVGNMNWGMGLIPKRQADALSKIKPPQIRKLILRQECKEHLVVVDQSWTGRAVDAEVGDLILLPFGTVVEGSVAECIKTSGSECLARAMAPGVGRAIAIEEGISALVFDYAHDHAYLEGVNHVDYGILRTIKQLTRHLEVSEGSEHQWQDAILQGFSVWRQLQTARKGVVVGDLASRTIGFEPP
jgi:Zn-dependent peptidase ImmA (M78 family)